MQLQLSAMYLFAVWAKLRGTTWNNGTAVSYALRVEEVSRIDLPAWFTQSEAVSNVLTFGTLATEVALATLVWNRRARPWVLGLGVAMHLLIDLSITVGFFSFVVFVGYLAFVPADTMSRWILAVRDRLRRSPLAASPTPNPSGPDPVPAPHRQTHPLRLPASRSRSRPGSPRRAADERGEARERRIRGPQWVHEPG